MKYTFVLYFFLVTGQVSFGQVLNSDSAGIGGKISVGGSINSGNLQRIGLVNTGDFFYKTKGGKFGLESHTQYMYTKTFGALQENDVLTRTLFYSKLNKHWFATLIFWYETNKLRQLHPLIQAGPSVEYAWLLKKHSKGGISVGVTYEHKHFDTYTFSDTKYNGSQNINTPRLFTRLHGQNTIGISKIVFTYDVYYMPSLQYANNYRVHAESSLAVPVTK